MAYSLAQHRLAQRPGRVQHSRSRLVSKRTAVLVHAQHKTELDVVLVGDIGGTNARLSAWRVDLEGAGATQIDKETYPSQDFKSLDAVVDAFLARPAIRERPPHAAALAIAGAVSANKCLMTNVGHWPIIDGDDIQSKHGFRVALLNDFEAVGYGIPVLGPHDVVTLNDVPVQPKAPKVVMGPGTGLGAAQLMWDTGLNAYKVWPGEGAHATFAPRGWKQKALARFVTERSGHCEIEEVACGSGLELIYEFLQSDEAANRPELLKHRTKKAVKDISAAALDGSDPLAVEAVDLMYAIVGAEAGAMALRCLAKGGVYIAGGITPKLLPRVKAGSLLEGFLMRNGREPFHKILTQTPLFVITNEQVGAMGAREVAKSLLHPRH